MANYSVIYEYREDDGMAYSMPTASGRVTVETRCGETEARALAIKHAYETHGNISHVRAWSVKQILD